MRISVPGTGIVGNTIRTALIKKGQQVKMGSRTANHERAGRPIITDMDQDDGQPWNIGF